MARTTRQSDVNEQRLIECYIDQDIDRYPAGRADARLLESGVSVWAIVAYLRVYSGDHDRVADHFGLSREAVEAALIFYRRNKPYIDARIALNEA